VHTNCGQTCVQPSLEDEAIRIVREYVPAEDWSDAWPIMVACMRIFRPERGALSHLFQRAWKRRRVDIYRHTQRRALPSTSYDGNVHGRAVEETAEDVEFAKTNLNWLRTQLSTKHMQVLEHSQRMSYEAAAHALGIPVGTFKSHLHRVTLRARELLASRVQTRTPAVG